MSLQRIEVLPARGPVMGSIVLLPAALQRLEQFCEAGFDDAVRRRDLPLRLVLVAPPMAHLADRDWIEVLRNEVIAAVPAAERPLWLGGISLGAFMALRYAATDAAGIDGLCLIAPYMGSRLVAAEIARCGSLQQWQPGTPAPEDDERHVWSYVRTLRDAAAQVFVGLAHDDRFADTQRLLAAALAPHQCVMVPGRHEWPMWLELWERFLDRLAAGR